MESMTRHSLDERKASEQIVKQAYSILDAHAHFRGRAARFEFLYQEKILIVRGSVPTFYLKQVLQSVLKDIEGVRKIENQVQVVSAAGLSGVRKR
jgi:hypothetical protein